MMKRVRRILLPSDFSDSAATAGEFAADLALRYDAGIDVVHVFKGAQDIEPFVDWLELDDSSEGRSSVMGDFLRHHAKPKLTAVLQKLVEFGVPQVRGRLLTGNPSRVIVDLASNGEYQLIVMASHGGSGIADALIGSCVERVVRRSPVPVLVVPTPKEVVSQQTLTELDDDAELFGWVGDPASPTS
jgi:nucleotide-binding universal stress UspA family protein